MIFNLHEEMCNNSSAIKDFPVIKLVSNAQLPQRIVVGVFSLHFTGGSSIFGKRGVNNFSQAHFFPALYRGFHGKGIFAVRVYYFARRGEQKK